MVNGRSPVPVRESTTGASTSHRPSAASASSSTAVPCSVIPQPAATPRASAGRPATTPSRSARPCSSRPVPCARARRARALRHVRRALGVRARRDPPRPGPHLACPEHPGPAPGLVLNATHRRRQPRSRSHPDARAGIGFFTHRRAARAASVICRWETQHPPTIRSCSSLCPRSEPDSAPVGRRPPQDREPQRGCCRSSKPS
jgi:hypothetical protein